MAFVCCGESVDSWTFDGCFKLGDDFNKIFPAAFSFFDSMEHEVVNDSDDLRILLIIDIWSDGLPNSIKKCLIENQSILKFGTIS